MKLLLSLVLTLALASASAMLVCTMAMEGAQAGHECCPKPQTEEKKCPQSVCAANSPYLSGTAQEILPAEAAEERRSTTVWAAAGQSAPLLSSLLPDGGDLHLRIRVLLI